MIKIYFCERVPEPDKKADGISQHRLAYRLLEQSIRENWSETEKEPFHYIAAPGGKPRLEGHPEIHFNISHCAACVACALGDAPVGIDVENRFPWKESLAARICHPLERERLRKLEPEEQEQWLNRIWSRKESYLKYLGTGIRRDLREFQVWEEEERQESACQKHRIDGETCFFRETQNSLYTLTVCGREALFQKPIRKEM
ncbi:MAG TPA: 4'-phosphopantetheinyl transferase superfamily protein [Candidatus Merdiplasma excrementigallinarum]|uniref:4'-phosphopantetheinyl transferase superfamily protein n=1 Tax=Candidatus Merdiplasma excrementigallinarum TaxID=2840864 RepID=A0A9D1T801_9FIRM|nr:4'-phosphopantetheinyl transferase superfamily protein [Candidatus Merdiplasma excrementigallinarum]